MKHSLKTAVLPLALWATCQSAAVGATEVSWKNVPTQIITAGGVNYAYRELGKQNGGTPVVFLVHLAAVLDNWDPRVMDGIAAKHHVIACDNRGIGACRTANCSSIPMQVMGGSSSSTTSSCAAHVNSWPAEGVATLRVSGTVSPPRWPRHIQRFLGLPHNGPF